MYKNKLQEKLEYIVLLRSSKAVVAQSAGAVEYTDCISVEGYEPLTSVLDMTLNSLMVRFQ